MHDPIEGNRPILVYDSGVGGLSIARDLISACPQERIHYLGDTLNIPYGSRTDAQLRKRFLNVLQFFVKRSYKVLIIACNTMSCIAKSFLPQYTKGMQKQILVLDVIDPIINYVQSSGPYRHIGLIGTTTTIQHGVYITKLKDHALKISALATPQLAHMVERSYLKAIDQDMLAFYLRQLDGTFMDLFIPACTHYIFLKEAIRAFFINRYQNDIHIVDVPQLVTEHIKHFLQKNHLNNHSRDHPTPYFMATKSTPYFIKTVDTLFNQSVSLVTL